MIFDTHASESIWSEFASNSSCVPSSLGLNEYISGKTLLITGAGGSIGSALARSAETCNPKALVLLDSNPRSLHALERSFDLSSKTQRVPVVGSICDSVCLRGLFALYRPQIILHAAACKHVPLMELNPLAGASTNIQGTYSLLQTASEYRAAQLIMVSTDKAVLPVSLMGATKRLAELLLLAHPDKALHRKAVRLGNVLGSSNSVGLLFRKQIREGGPVTVTHPDAHRFFLTLNHAVALLLNALSTRYESGILIPDLGRTRRVEELARYLIAVTAKKRQKIRIIYTALRPGDKREEVMSSPYDSAGRENDLFSIVQPAGGSVNLRTIVEQVNLSVRRSDLRLLLESICEAVPEYHPGPVLQRVIETHTQPEPQK
jgi:FlaA1/EpsC-like NDP-sugar epimerase